MIHDPKGAASSDEFPHAPVVHRLLQITRVHRQSRLQIEVHMQLCVPPVIVEVVLVPQPVVLHDPDLSRNHPRLSALLDREDHKPDGRERSEDVSHPLVRLIRCRRSVGNIKPAQRHRPHLLLLVRHHDRSMRHGHQRYVGAGGAATRRLQLRRDRSAQNVLSDGVLFLDIALRQAGLVAGDLHRELQVLPAEKVKGVRVRSLVRLLLQLLAFVVPDGLHIKLSGRHEPENLVLRHPKKRKQTRIVARVLVDQLGLRRAQVDHERQLAVLGILVRDPLPCLVHGDACAAEHRPEH
mmetsp:Transcript_22076/g.63345  ORF Transcript_22076/g.63345 Transcript_22076/m.63345 type:complete len:295 (-) Transcript_22076:225-1109(-)